MKIRKIRRGAMIAALMIVLPVGNSWATHRSEAEQAISEAKAAHQKAKSAGVASPDTAQMIEKAESLLPSRQYTKAVQIAEDALKQDEFAYEQSMSGKDSKPEAAAEAEQAITAAEEARKKAASVGGEWRDTGAFIREAQGLAREGEYAAAIALANKAKRQGELGYEQAIREKDAGFPSYVGIKP